MKEINILVYYRKRLTEKGIEFLENTDITFYKDGEAYYLSMEDTHKKEYIGSTLDDVLLFIKAESEDFINEK